MEKHAGLITKAVKVKANIYFRRSVFQEIGNAGFYPNTDLAQTLVKEILLV